MTNAPKVSRFLLLGVLAGWLLPVFADPPAHAPAHGWRKKNDPLYVGYSGGQWEHDFDISSGKCNRQEIATVVGGIVGGAIANRVADEHKVVATLIGAAAGALIGNRIGRELDEADRSCFGHALEVGAPGQVVTWTNESTGVRYEMSPGSERQRNGATCRDFTLVAVAGDARSSKRGVACPAEPGVWQIAQ
jgi:surface antigen